MDTDAWVKQPNMECCDECGTPKIGGPRKCKSCGAGKEKCHVLSYAGCGSCRPEKYLQGRVRHGVAAGLLARSAIAFAAMCAVSSGPAGLRGRSQEGYPSGTPAAASTLNKVNTVKNPVFHIVEEPGGIRYMADCEVPTQAYYDALAEDMKKRHPNTSQHNDQRRNVTTRHYDRWRNE